MCKVQKFGVSSSEFSDVFVIFGDSRSFYWPNSVNLLSAGFLYTEVAIVLLLVLPRKSFVLWPFMALIWSNLHFVRVFSVQCLKMEQILQEPVLGCFCTASTNLFLFSARSSRHFLVGSDSWDEKILECWWVTLKSVKLWNTCQWCVFF